MWNIFEFCCETRSHSRFKSNFESNFGFSTEYKNILRKCYLAIVLTCLQVSSDSKKIIDQKLCRLFLVDLVLWQIRTKTTLAEIDRKYNRANRKLSYNLCLFPERNTGENRKVFLSSIYYRDLTSLPSFLKKCILVPEIFTLNCSFIKLHFAM